MQVSCIFSRITFSITPRRYWCDRQNVLFHYSFSRKSHFQRKYCIFMIKMLNNGEIEIDNYLLSKDINNFTGEQDCNWTSLLNTLSIMSFSILLIILSLASPVCSCICVRGKSNCTNNMKHKELWENSIAKWKCHFFGNGLSLFVHRKILLAHTHQNKVIADVKFDFSFS